MTRPRGERPANCLKCGIPLSAPARLTKAPEGTRKHGGKGLCVRCYDHQNKKHITRTPRPRAENCRDCNHKLRPSRTTAEDYPGTKAHHGFGLCYACCARARRDPTNTTPQTPHAKPLTPEQLDYYRRGEARYQANRRARLQRQARLNLIKKAAA